MYDSMGPSTCQSEVFNLQRIVDFLEVCPNNHIYFCHLQIKIITRNMIWNIFFNDPRKKTNNMDFGFLKPNEKYLLAYGFALLVGKTSSRLKYSVRVLFIFRLK